MSTAQYLVRTPREAHEVLNEIFQVQIKPHTAHGRPGIVTWQTVSAYRRHQLRKMFHGPVLRDIAEQVWVPDPAGTGRVRYMAKVWKEFFSQLFIAPTFESYTVRSTGEVKLRECHRSTEALDDDAFAEFLLQVQAFAVVDLNVTFTEQDDQP